MTEARNAVLACLANQQRPISLAQMEKDLSLKGRFDAATLYRTVIMLKDLEIIRQISVDQKLRYFVLNSPDESGAYLICHCCGKITPLAADAVDEKRVEEAVHLGYLKVKRLVELRGLCPRCQTKPGIDIPNLKQSVRI
ncbi:MAG: transcriptional repressor [Verrucomicrobiota bacterium]|nr:transcriptional repressor [Verrucomicrobiota bacterium]